MNSSTRRTKSFESEKLAFYTWAIKWASNNITMKEKDVPIDVPQIAAVLQAMGFKLETIDQSSNNEKSDSDTLDMKIEIKCNKSGIRAILSKHMKTCVCPSSEIANQGQFWTVSGTGPSTSQDNLNKIDETRSNLVPVLSKEKSMVIRDVLTKLFVIMSETDVNQNEQCSSNVRDSLRIRSLSDLSKPIFARHDTWEVDPKISPPTRTSSPISQQSNSDKEQLLAELLVTAKEHLDKALILLPSRNNTFTKTNVKRISNIKASPTVGTSNIKASPTVGTPTRATTGKSTPDLPTRKTPKKKIDEITPKLGEKRFLTATSKIGSFRKKTETFSPRLTPTTSKPKLLKTTSTLALNKISPMSAGIPDQKRTLGTISKYSSLRGSNTNIAISPGLKVLKPKTAIPSFGFQSVAGKSGVSSSVKRTK